MARKKKEYYRRPDGLYETSRTINGKRVVFRGRTCAEVDRKMLEYRIERERGRKFPVIADEWYSAKSGEVALSTHMTYRYALDRLKEHFTGYASDYKPLDIMRYVRAFEAKGYHRATVNVEVSVMKQIFSHAVIQGDIDVSPASEVTVGKGLPQKVRHALTEEQELAVDAYRGEDWLLGYMLLYTGMRRGELMALTYQDIDRQAGQIHVTKKVNYCTGHPQLEHVLKSARGRRDIPLLAPLAEAIPTGRIGLMFPGEDGGHMVQSAMRRRWERYCRAIGFVAVEDGVEKFPVTMHCFRHSFATICYEAGIDEKSAAAMLGDSEKVTREVYTELRRRRHADSAERVNAYLELRAQDRREA